jgi:hypothetical protein
LLRTVTGSPVGGRFLAAWLGWVSLGESLGFLAPVLLQQLGSKSSPAMMLPLLIFAGLVEGAFLGWSQAHVLRRLLPGLSVRRWTLCTSLAAAVAWILGLAPSEFNQVWAAWPFALQLTVGLLTGTALLASIGVAQWLELRRHLPRSWRWIPGTAAAWLVGLLIFLAVSTPLWQPGQPPVLIALIGVLAGAAMAIGMAMVTGLVMVGMVFDPATPRAQA